MHAGKLIRQLLAAFVWRRASLEAIVEGGGQAIGTRHKSTLSYALRRPSVLKVAWAMIDGLQQKCSPAPLKAVAIDSMAMTLACTQRSDAGALNNQTVGIGVMWEFEMDAAPGTNPVRILKVARGPWNDSRQIRDCQLVPEGPVYLMDRGFYAFGAIAGWLDQKVRFIVRAKKQQCHYQSMRTLGRPRKVSKKVRIVFDGIAILGKDPRNQITVRLVWAEAAGKDLILASSLFGETAEKILALYKKRWDIERFHKLLKQAIGLAHLYSFQQNGMELLVLVAVMLATLLYMSEHTGQPGCAAASHHDVVKCIRQALRTIRKSLAVTEWKQNTPVHTWKKKRRNH